MHSALHVQSAGVWGSGRAGGPGPGPNPPPPAVSRLHGTRGLSAHRPFGGYVHKALIALDLALMACAKRCAGRFLRSVGASASAIKAYCDLHVSPGGPNWGPAKCGGERPALTHAIVSPKEGAGGAPQSR